MLQASWSTGSPTGLAITLLDAIVQLDEAVFAAIAPWRTAFLVELFKVITLLGDGLVVNLLGLGLTIVLWNRGPRALVPPLWMTVWGAQLTTSLSKRLFDRARPELLLDVMERSAAFPSGHATASMALYGFIAWWLCSRVEDRGLRAVIVASSGLAILLVGFSRVFLSVHHASDVVAGYAVGALWLAGGIAMAQATRARASRKRSGEDAGE